MPVLKNLPKRMELGKGYKLKGGKTGKGYTVKLKKGILTEKRTYVAYYTASKNLLGMMTAAKYSKTKKALENWLKKN